MRIFVCARVRVVHMTAYDNGGGGGGGEALYGEAR